MKKLLAVLMVLTLALGLIGTAAADEVVTLKVLARTSDLTANQPGIDVLNEKLEKAIGVRLEWYCQASSGYPDFVNNMLQTWDPEDVYDLIYVQSTSINPMYLGKDLETLVDMTELVENSTYLKPAMEKDAIFAAQFAACPYLLWPSDVNQVLQFRTDALEACPSWEAFQQKPDQAAYTQLLKELKDQGYEAAFTTQASIDYLLKTGVDSGFGITSTWMKNEDGSYTYNRVSENFLKELQWYRQLYVDGVLSKNWATDNWESMENSLYTGVVAGIAMKGGAYTVYYDNNTVTNYGEGAHLSILPPMVGPNGEQSFAITSQKFDRGWVISSSSANVEKAFEVLDWMMSDEGRMFDLFGVEGTDYTVNEDGTLNLLVSSDATSIYRIFDADVFGNVDVRKVATTGAKYWPDASFVSADVVAQYGIADNDFVIPDEHVINWTACESLWKEFATQYILGEKTDADWATFVETWHNYGGEAVEEYAAEVLE